MHRSRYHMQTCLFVCNAGGRPVLCNDRGRMVCFVQESDWESGRMDTIKLETSVGVAPIYPPECLWAARPALRESVDAFEVTAVHAPHGTDDTQSGVVLYALPLLFRLHHLWLVRLYRYCRSASHPDDSRPWRAMLVFLCLAIPLNVTRRVWFTILLACWYFPISELFRNAFLSEFLPSIVRAVYGCVYIRNLYIRNEIIYTLYTFPNSLGRNGRRRLTDILMKVAYWCRDFWFLHCIDSSNLDQ